MIVTFISQCEKKSLKRTRQVLDAYANRIGDNAWQTIITEEGLLMVKKLLRKTASKNTAVSCHWIRSRRRTDLLWIVGNRNKFNSEGHVPVNCTQKSTVIRDEENDWHYLPLLKGITAISALLHDWGKCSDLFQKKLINKNDKFKGDPLRHEWISCLVFQCLVELSGDLSDDYAWLELLKQNSWDEKKIIKGMGLLIKDQKFKKFETLPPVAQMISWIILSHHRLPNLQYERDYEKYTYEEMPALSELLSTIGVMWGYQNNFDDTFEKRLNSCFKFSQGLLKDSPEWIRYLRRWANRLQQCLPELNTVFSNGSWRSIIQYSRLSLMLGDHYFSSLPKDYDFKKPWNRVSLLLANTDRQHNDQKKSEPKQYLDQHLVGVYTEALKVVQSLKPMSYEMPYAYDLKKIKQKSPERFIWQDKAVTAIKAFKKKIPLPSEQGWFIVNMASTGTGKTIANAKIMQALSEEQNALRYILALGLRTLTLQTGDAYRNYLGMDQSELAVLIGSKAVQELHEKAQVTSEENQDMINYDGAGSESLEALMVDELVYEDEHCPEFLDVLFPKKNKKIAEKNKAFLNHPILVCTIDHLMGATETTRGGKYLLPYLRLLSSDLVIDEVDDFNPEDLIPIGRLIHLAGMLGRKVMISSATIPPDLAEGFFHAYQKGWESFCAFRNIAYTDINTVWVDEFTAKVDVSQKYCEEHYQYIQTRCKNLVTQIIKQRARIVPCDHLVSSEQLSSDESLQSRYFELIRENIEHLHNKHHTIDPVSGKRISFGVVRIANIPPCVALTRYLLNAYWCDGTAPRIMAYHSRQILLLRSIQERHLDHVLKRNEQKGQSPQALNDPIIRAHIDNSNEDNIIFILVATPVEEVGRDHDFDWAIIEPSSYRSIIQLSGRVLRHRQLDDDIDEPNIAIMQFNLKGIHKHEIAFTHPGFEIGNEKFKLATKNLMDLLAHDNGKLNINAIPRIYKKSTINPTKNLADLEHARIQDTLTENHKGAKSLHGWLDEVWFLTGLPQQFNRFRKSTPSVQLYAIYENDKVSFHIRDDDGRFVSKNQYYDIQQIQLEDLEISRLWFHRDYQLALIEMINDEKNTDSDMSVLLKRASERYGEILLPSSKAFNYSDQLGIFDR